jgi:hypothetical protein
MGYDKDVEVNDDGKTAFCSICEQDKPLEGFTTDKRYYSLDRFEPPEDIQVCKDCQDAEEKQSKEMEEYYGDGVEEEEIERCPKCSRRVPSGELEANNYLCGDCVE